MGSHAAIAADRFPKQGTHAGRRVEVCFHYDRSVTLGGLVVRDDVEAPCVTIIRLDDGRFVTSDECQYRPADER